MNSTDFIRDFTDWIFEHTPIESLHLNESDSELIFYATTSEKNTFLQNSMIFTEYDYTSYCKLYNFNNFPYLEIEFLSGNKAVIKFISSDFEMDSEIKELFTR